MSKPLFTVFMPVYNGSSFITEAIESILSQSFADFELLIIDDGSEDNSVEIVENFRDARVRLLRNDKNRGLAFTRNRGVSEARGKYFAILDSDDISTPDRLKIQYEFFIENEDVAMCGGRAVYIDQSSRYMGHSPPYRGNKNCLLLFGNILINSTVTIKLDVLRSVGSYSTTSDLAEDYEVAMRIAEQFPIEILDHVLAKYRFHTKNISITKFEDMKTAEREVFKNFHLRMGLRSNDRLVDLHHSLIDGRFSAYSLHEYFQFLVALAIATTSHTTINSYELKKTIFDKWFDLVLEKGGTQAIFLLFKAPLYDNSFVTARQLRKALKRSLKSLLKQRHSILF